MSFEIDYEDLIPKMREAYDRARAYDLNDFSMSQINDWLTFFYYATLAESENGEIYIAELLGEEPDFAVPNDITSKNISEIAVAAYKWAINNPNAPIEKRQEAMMTAHQGYWLWLSVEGCENSYGTLDQSMFEAFMGVPVHQFMSEMVEINGYAPSVTADL